MRKKVDSSQVPIKDLFAVYRERLRAPQGSVTAAAKDVIHDLLSITLESKHLSYTPSSRILRITVGGPVKSEIFLRKKEIITHLKGRLGPKSAPTEIL
jgi:hypothetical protein